MKFVKDKMLYDTDKSTLMHTETITINEYDLRTVWVKKYYKTINGRFYLVCRYYKYKGYFLFYSNKCFNKNDTPTFESMSKEGMFNALTNYMSDTKALEIMGTSLQEA